MKTIVSYLFLISTQFVFSQRELLTEIPDSLKNKSYDELKYFYNDVKVPFDEKFIYCNVYLIKSRDNNDTLNICEASIFDKPLIKKKCPREVC